MKGFNIALLALLAAEPSIAFVQPGMHHGSRPILSMTATSTESDVSVPYDAAAKLAYDEWIETYGKTYDAKRYEVFKANYEAIAVLNVSAKKKARDEGTTNPSLFALNEYADCTSEEYEAALRGEAPSSSSSSSSSGDVLGKAVQNAEAQMAASSALQEAADALAKEEEKLAAKLGLESVEELEIALDSMEGIAPDGGEMDDGALAREARVRSAYLDWCKEYGKEPDESRFPLFSSNYLDMEEFAKESGKEMLLNEYADRTEEEYAAIMGGDSKEEEAKAAAKAAAAAKAEAAQEAAEKKRAEAEAAAKERAAREAKLAAMSDEERRKEIEKEKSARQSEQAKDMEKLRIASEADAIQAAKAVADKEAAAAARRRQIEEEAAEIARAKARAWEEKQAAMKPKPVARSKPAPQKQVLDLGSFFSAPASKKAPPKTPAFDFFGGGAPAPKAAAKKPAPKPAAKKVPAPRPTLSLGDIFNAPKAAPVKKSAPVPAPVPPKAVKSTPAPSRPTLSLGDIFSTPKASPAKKISAPAPVLQKTPALDTSDPVTEAFSSFFGGKKSQPKSKAPAPAQAPAPAPKAKTAPAPKPFFSFGAPAPKPAPKVTPAPVPAPAPKPMFSFGAPAPKPAPKMVSAPAPAPRPSFSLFGNPKPAAKPVAPPAPAPAPRPTLSLFGKKPAPSPAPAPAPSSAPRPSLSLFGGSPKKAAPKAAPKATPKAAPARPTLSLFGGPKGAPKSKVSAPKAAPKAKQAASPKDNIPVMTRWKQNPDGSITGFVSNSKTFRNGERITTSPVKKGAKGGGAVVRTGSGSQYRLM